MILKNLAPILINGLCLTQGNIERGIGNYSVQLINALRSNTHNKILLILSDDIDENAIKFILNDNIEIVKLKLFQNSMHALTENHGRYYLNRKILTHFVNSINPSFFLELNHIGEGWANSNVGVNLTEISNIKKNVIAYDIIPVKFRNYFCNNIFEEFYINSILNIGGFDNIFTISNKTRTDILNFFDDRDNKFIDSEKFITIYGGHTLDTSLYVKQTDRDYILLIPGGVDSRKNIFNALLAFNRILSEFPDMYLYITGHKDQFSDIIKYCGEAKILKNIIFTGYLNSHELYSYLTDCKLFISTSLDEGLCLPLINTMFLGKKFVLSDIPIFHEIAHNSKYFFNPLIPEDIANCIIKKIRDEEPEPPISTLLNWDSCVYRIIESNPQIYFETTPCIPVLNLDEVINNSPVKISTDEKLFFNNSILKNLKITYDIYENN